MHGDKPKGPGDRKANGEDGGESGKPASDKLDIGAALRTVYDDAAGEDVPPEMLDLLGKLN
ncbi:MAG: hypothetical protein HKN78_00850 [Sphingomonadaceae bacterium]|nr:hypothetical protein [Sphingomonadaceae bacterium]